MDCSTELVLYYRSSWNIGGSIKDAEKNGIVVSPGKGAIMKGIFYLKQGEAIKYNHRTKL